MLSPLQTRISLSLNCLNAPPVPVPSSTPSSSNVRRKLTKRRPSPIKHPLTPVFISLPPPDDTVSDPEISSSHQQSSAFPDPTDSDNKSTDVKSLNDDNDRPESRPRPGWLRTYGDSLITRWSKMDVSDAALIARLDEIRSNSEGSVEPNVNIDDEEEQEVVPSDHHFLEDDRTWNKARRALFCCREIIRTELSYMEGLLQLENSETSTSPPVILLQYLPALIEGSIQLSAKMLSNPTAYGVSRAFIEEERRLEEAFVPWCGIIGETLECDDQLSRRSSGDGHRKLVRSNKTSSTGSKRKPLRSEDPCESTIHEGQVQGESHLESFLDTDPNSSKGTGVKNLFRRLSVSSSSNQVSIRTSAPSLPTETPASAGPTETGFSSWPTLLSPRPSLVQSKRRSKTLSYPAKNTINIPRRRNTYKDTLASHTSRSFKQYPPTVRKLANAQDLSIQPTQRVMRYALLFNDLLSHTADPCASRQSVQEAVEASTRLASKCDRAQNNAMFLRD